MIPQSFIDDLLCRVDLPAFIGEYVDLVRKGASHEGCCPFHAEKTPSFKVFPDHYHCFGCGAHGNAVNFMTENLGMAFPDAVRALAARTGIPIEDDSQRHVRASPHREAIDTLSQACAEYQRLLFAPEDNPAMAELDRRGIDTDIAVRYGLGYAPEQWGTLSQNKAFRQKALMESGLCVARAEGKGCYDRFRNRLVFPVLDIQGRVIGFGGRNLGTEGPKYLNTPETALYQKGTVLFGLHQAKPALRRDNHVIVAEGYFDVITPAMHGIENVVSTCGTALTEIQAELLLSIADRVTFCFDGDAAGNKATWAAAALLVPRVNDGHEVRMCRLSVGHDPDSLVRTDGAQAFAAAIEGAPTLVDYLTAEIARGARSAESRSRAVHAAIAQWRNFAAPTLKIFFRQAICAAVGLTEDEFSQLALETTTAPGDSMLRQCHGCGAKAHFITESDGYRAACTNSIQCGLSTPILPTREQVQTIWNRRERFRYAA